jgi:DNA repair exonuclease SbcCD ATPase subunit
MTEVEKSIHELEISVNANRNDIDDMKTEIHDLKGKQSAIYELTTSVKLIAQSLSGMKEDIEHLKDGQENVKNFFNGKVAELESHVTLIEQKPLVKTQSRIDAIQEKIMWLIIGGIISGILYYIIPFFHG